MNKIGYRIFSVLLAMGVLFFFSNFFPSLAEAADGQSFFYDFNDGRADGWSFSSDRWKVENGRLMVYGPGNKTPDGQTIYLDIATHGGLYGDCRIDADINRVAGQYTSAGISVTSSNYDHYLYFTLSNLGYYVIFKWDGASNTIVPAIPWAKSDCIKADENQENALSVVREGADFSFYINGCFLIKYHDESIGEAILGLMAMLRDDISAASFDNIRVAVAAPEQKYSLAVKTDSLRGTVYDASGSINCGTNCQASFVKGSAVELTAKPNPGWKFLLWDAGNECFAANPITITMDAPKNYQAQFILDGNAYWLELVDGTLLGKRIPLVLIHGNGGEEIGSPYGWNNYTRAINRNAVLRKKFKMYLFRWDSNVDNMTGGLALGATLDQYPELRDKAVVILTHSRGGLIARYFMNYYKVTEGLYINQWAGNKVRKLLTLATPHHGSPGADRWWVDLMINSVYKTDPDLAYLVSWAYFNVLWEPSFQYLLWDNISQELTRRNVQWDSIYLGANQSRQLESVGTDDIYKLNQAERYFGKIVAFGGNNTKFNMNIWEIVTTAIGMIGDSHARLDLGSLLMANMPMVRDNNGSVWIDTSTCRFMANDGMVDIFSSLGLRVGYEDIFKINKKGVLVYSAKKLAQAKLFKKVIPIGFLVDHQDFLDNPRVIKQVIAELLLK